MIDLDAVAALVGDATVVGLGESLHAVGDFYRLKDRIFRHLVEHCDFRVFALEAGFAEGLLVDAWIKGSDDDLDDVLRRGFTYNMGCCEEFVEQLTWMQSWNESHPDDPVHYAGTDVPGWLESAHRAFDVVDALLERVDPDAPVRGSSDAAELAAWLANREPVYASRSSKLAAASATRAAETADTLHRILAGARPSDAPTPRQAIGESFRDMTMAHTVLWLLRVHGPDTRVVFGAHNGHLQRTSWLRPESLPAGAYLAHHLGGSYVPIATTFGRAIGFEGEVEDVGVGGLEPVGYGAAPEDTVDHAMSVSGRVVVNLRRESVAGTRMRLQAHSIPVDIGAAFDALVHVDEVRGFTPRSLERPDG